MKNDIRLSKKKKNSREIFDDMEEEIQAPIEEITQILPKESEEKLRDTEKKDFSQEKVDYVTLPPKLTESSEEVEIPANKANIIGGVAIGLGAAILPFIPILGIAVVAFGIAMLGKDKIKNKNRIIENTSEKIITRDGRNSAELENQKSNESPNLNDVAPTKYEIISENPIKYEIISDNLSKPVLQAKLSPMAPPAIPIITMTEERNIQNLKSEIHIDRIISHQASQSQIEEFDPEMFNLIEPAKVVAEGLGNLMKDPSNKITEQDQNIQLEKQINENNIQESKSEIHVNRTILHQASQSKKGDEEFDQEMNNLTEAAKNLAEGIGNLMKYRSNKIIEQDRNMTINQDSVKKARIEKIDNQIFSPNSTPNIIASGRNTGKGRS